MIGRLRISDRPSDGHGVDVAALNPRARCGQTTGQRRLDGRIPMGILLSDLAVARCSVSGDGSEGMGIHPFFPRMMGAP